MDGGPMPLRVGAACIPPEELSTSFLGFDYHEVTLDQGNAACGAGVCLVNHFQGRVSCPYGQNEAATGAAGTLGGSFKCGDPNPTPSSPCCTPGSDRPVIATKDVGSSTPAHSQVSSNCSDRTADKAVYCSCRCANAAGKTNDGASYCSCPSSYSCLQIVPELMTGDPRAGAYCIPDGTAYDRTSSCTSLPCDPTKGDCPEADAGTLPAPDADTESTSFVTPVQVSFLQPGSCWFTPMPTDATGKSTCDMFYELAAGDSCASHPGLSIPDPTITASILRGLGLTMPETICLLAELAPTPCASSSQPGWCYLTGAAAPTGCAQALETSQAAPLPPGSIAILGCP